MKNNKVKSAKEIQKMIDESFEALENYGRNYIKLSEKIAQMREQTQKALDDLNKLPKQ